MQGARGLAGDHCEMYPPTRFHCPGGPHGTPSPEDGDGQFASQDPGASRHSGSSRGTWSAVRRACASEWGRGRAVKPYRWLWASWWCGLGALGLLLGAATLPVLALIGVRLVGDVGRMASVVPVALATLRHTSALSSAGSRFP
jgi:hypothetical protein